VLKYILKKFKINYFLKYKNINIIGVLTNNVLMVRWVSPEQIDFKWNPRKLTVGLNLLD